MSAHKDTLRDAFACALMAIMESTRASDAALPNVVAVAYSGGLDSAVLLHLAHEYAAACGMALHAFHIHHGLSPHADQWREHCRAACAALQVPFDCRQVTVRTGDSGVEEAARLARYAALGALCVQHGAPLLLTAHHLDDQAETVLLQLLRGSGVAGLSGMERANRAADLLGSEAVTMARPLLSVSRAELDEYARVAGIAHVEDESNRDPRFARNALRHQVMPALAACFPGFQARFARTAQHAQSAQRLLVDLAMQDFAACGGSEAGNAGEWLDVSRIGMLDADRANNLLRYWFGLRGVRMPSSAWLNEMRTQLLEAKEDAQLCVTHADCHIRRHRNRVFMTPREDAATRDAAGNTAPAAFVWQGEALLRFPAYGGVLHFDVIAAGNAGESVDENGIDAAWLRGRNCTLHYRQGGERLKPAPNRPTKSLKYHYQAMDIPAWERSRLPMVSSGGALLFAAGLGMDCAQFGNAHCVRIRLRWQADPGAVPHLHARME